MSVATENILGETSAPAVVKTPSDLPDLVLPPALLIIEPTPTWKALDLREIWRYRDLLWFLALRDIQVRYKQTALGAAWAILQPVFTMVVFSLFFGHLGGLGNKIENGIPYPVFTLCALLPWQMFAFALAQSSGSIVGNRNLITKVYFPRLIIPMAPLLCGLLDFAISFGVLVLMMACYGIFPGWSILTLPVFLFLALLTSLAVGLWLAALNAIYRDVQYTIGFLTQFWLFATPIAYPANIVPEPWRTIYGLNPMVGVVEGFRWSLLGAAPPSLSMMLMSLGMMTLVLVGGFYYFRRMEKVFIDVV